MLKTLPLPPHRFHRFCLATALAPLTLGVTVLTGAISPAKAQLIIQQGAPIYQGVPTYGVPQQSTGSFIYGSPIPSPIPINPTTGMSDRGSSNNYRLNRGYYPSYPDNYQGYPNSYPSYPDDYYQGYPNSYPSYPRYPVGSNGGVNNSTLINPTLINPQIRDSVLINPVIVSPRGNRRHFNRPRRIIIR